MEFQTMSTFGNDDIEVKCSERTNVLNLDSNDVLSRGNNISFGDNIEGTFKYEENDNLLTREIPKKSSISRENINDSLCTPLPVFDESLLNYQKKQLTQSESTTFTSLKADIIDVNDLGISVTQAHDMLTENDLKNDTREIYSNMNYPEHYYYPIKRNRANRLIDTDFDYRDDYKDDDDPGYRIRDAYEHELVTEIHKKLRYPINFTKFNIAVIQNNMQLMDYCPDDNLLCTAKEFAEANEFLNNFLEKKYEYENNCDITTDDNKNDDELNQIININEDELFTNIHTENIKELCTSISNVNLFSPKLNDRIETPDKKESRKGTPSFANVDNNKCTSNKSNISSRTISTKKSIIQYNNPISKYDSYDNEEIETKKPFLFLDSSLYSNYLDINNNPIDMDIMNEIIENLIVSIYDDRKLSVLDATLGQSVLIHDIGYHVYYYNCHLQSNLWRETYSHGDIDEHQKKKKEEKERSKVTNSIIHPKSSDRYYPCTVNNVTYDCLSLRVIFDRDKTGFEDQKDSILYNGNIIAGRYTIIDELGSAAFSTAVKAYDKIRGHVVCLKVIKNEKDYFDQSLDEIKLLRLINNNCNADEKNIIRILDYFYYKEHLIIVTELLRDNLYEYFRYLKERCAPQYYTLNRLQKITKQILVALEFVHSLKLIHCDLKPENILIKRFKTAQIKVIDFGSSCYEGDNLSTYVQSRSYRAPEVLLGLPYDTKIDIWSLGCVIAELWSGYVLFQNDSTVSLMSRIIGIIGTIPHHMLVNGKYASSYFTQDGLLYMPLDNEDNNSDRKMRILVPKVTNLWQRMRTYDNNFLDFITKCLIIDPAYRPSASELLQHPWIVESKYEHEV